MHKFIPALGAILFSVVGHADVLSCKVDGQTGSYLLVMNSTLDKSKEATLLSIADKAPAGTYSSVRGAAAITSSKQATVFTFATSVRVDWSKVPEKSCYVSGVEDDVVLNTPAKTDKEITGTITAEMRFRIRPGVEKCSTPDPVPGRPLPFTCTPATLQVDTK